jgi:hypothetical protein
MGTIMGMVGTNCIRRNIHLDSSQRCSDGRHRDYQRYDYMIDSA